MDSQPTQQGMMQLFMSLGLSQHKSLELDVNSAQKADTLGFANLLQQYQTEGDGSAFLEPELSGLSLPDLNGKDAMSFEPLPLEGSEGQDLPLNGLNLPPFRQAMQDYSLQSRMTKPSVLDGELEDKVLTNSEFTDQNFLAQSLVASVLANPDAQSNQSIAASQGAYLGANSVVNNALDNRLTSTQPALRTNTLTASQIKADKLSLTASASLTPATSSINTAPADDSFINGSSVNGLGDGLLGLDDQVDKFLGADTGQSVIKNTSNELNASINNQGDVSKIANLAAGSQEMTAALAHAEDPSLESLQDIEALEELEQAEVENKLASTERKQDEQTLKLSKGQQAWGEALTERITMNAAKDVKQVTIHLDPPELGSLELKLQVKEDQQTQVQVQVQNPQVKEALESSAQRLRDMLANQGLELSEFDVQTGAQQGGAQGEQQAKSEEAQGQQDSDALTSLEEEISLDISRPKNNNLLDTFV